MTGRVDPPRCARHSPMSDLHVVVLAAGKGTRMRSELPKVLHRISGQTLLDYVLRAAGGLSPAPRTLVVGHKAETVRAELSGQQDVRFAMQEPQLGTAHAVMQAEPLLAGASGTMLLLSGDVPLLSTTTLTELLRAHHTARAAGTVLTAVLDRPYGYGRIVRSQGHIARIAEERDASPSERAIREINAGVYAFDLEPLFPALRSIASQNAQGEYYLTDLYWHLPAARAGGRQPHRCRRGRNTRDQQPNRTGGSRCARETEEERRTDGGRGDACGSGHDLYRTRRSRGG